MRIQQYCLRAILYSTLLMSIVQNQKAL